MPVFPTKTHSEPACRRLPPFTQKRVKQRKHYMSTCRLFHRQQQVAFDFGLLLPMSLLGSKTKCASLTVFSRVLVAGWELTLVLSALLSNKLLAAQRSVRRLQLHPKLHPCCIKEEYRISQRLIFNSVFYRYVELGKENPQQSWKWARVNRRLSSHARFYLPLVKGLSYH